MVETTATARRDLLLVRLYFFTWVGAGGFLLPFLAIFFRRQGLSGLQIGLIGTVQAIAALFAAPVWGRWNDRFNRPRRLMQIGLLATAIIMLIVGLQDQFWIIAVLVGLDALLSAGLEPLSTNLANNIAERAGAGYGSVRLWGSLGWTVVTAAGGRIIQSLGIYVAFVGYAVSMVASAVIVRFLPREDALPDEDGGPPAVIPANIGEVLSTIRNSPRLMSLVVGLGIVWFLSSGLYQFESIFLDELGASETLIGLANAINAAVELPAMLWADRLLRRRTPGWLLRGAFLLQAVRMVSILAFPTIPMIMAMRVVIGLQFSLFSVGLIGYITEYTGRSYRVTTLALITVTLRNLVSMVGNPVSGLIYDAAGAYWLYVPGLVGALGAWLALQLGRVESRRAA
jgi:PPP family 3-phenylpropionic acid transporter